MDRLRRRSVTVLAVRAVDVPVIVVLMVVRVVMRMAMVVMGMIVMPVIVSMMPVVVAMIAVAVLVVGVPVIVPVVMVVVTAGAVVVGDRLLLGAERALERGGLTALAADQVGHRRIVEDVERVGGHLGLDVVAAELPGEAGEPQRVLGRDGEERLRGGEDAHQPPVLQAHGVAVLQDRRPVEIEPEGETARGGEVGAAGRAGGVVEGDLVGDGVGAYGGFADDGGGALHRVLAGIRAGADRAPFRAFGARAAGPGACGFRVAP